jgi:hypothetical protein
MDFSTFLGSIKDRAAPASEADLFALEASLGSRLPDDYRQFVRDCNGGHVGGLLWFYGRTPTGEMADAGIHHIGGLREESYLSLTWARDCYAGHIPDDLLWIMDDPFGNAICLCIRGESRGSIFFWDHENQGSNGLQPLAASFGDFVTGVQLAAHDT